MKSAPRLLSRDAFRDGVMARDQGRCVICGAPAVNAHHLIERRLWLDGGYYLENGAAVCADDHLRCEETLISVEELREACGITRVVVPAHLYPDERYDKWGNVILANGQRLKGELFFDASVQRILEAGGVLPLFTPWVKQPRTHHVPWSPGVHADDRVIDSMDRFQGRRVIVTRKMDGENTSLYADHIHARSLDGRDHPSRHWVKNFWSGIRQDIPSGWRICGENLYAEHSIAYRDLASYFQGFAVWNERNVCLDWDSTQEWFALLGICSVPVLYDGLYDERLIRGLWSDRDWGKHEGYVMRLAEAFEFGEFRRSVGKFVRRGHVQTTKHWMYGQPVTRNGLAT